ncbi:MAG TPA: uroporphyrinogen-III C-methyltransferase, partial [Pirellulaceae bacterium]|nr:uroporphyrinogen-III C-methyltransferase [Pirellulaceae bacterium]
MTEPSPSTPPAPSSPDTVAPERRGAAKVYLVGAGPGDSGLITMRGVACLQRAEVVLYDYLVNPEIVAHAPAAAEVHCLGKHGRTRIWTQDEINRAMVDFAAQGRTVVRLKGGDPAVFGRIAEETDYLRRHGIEFEIVPGVTAALAAGSYAGIPITHRDVASAVAFIAGREDADKTETALDFNALARFPGTLVFYMGVTTAPQWTRALLDAGKSADTPAAIVRRCSLPDQTTIITTLGRLTDEIVPATKLRPPLVVILGEVVRLKPMLDWFERRPLFGQRVLVTRPADQAGGLVEPLAQLGAELRVQPAIRIGPPTNWGQVDAAIARLSEFDWVVFSSANGVRYLLDRLRALGRDARAFGTARLAVIGPGTAAELDRYQLRADCVPSEYRAE